MYGSLTLTGALFQEASTRAFVSDGSKDYNSRPRGPDFHLEFFPLHSPLLKESKFVSFPLLTYMLKFSRFAILTSGQQKEVRSTRDVDKLPDRPPSASRPQG